MNYFNLKRKITRAIIKICFAFIPFLLLSLPSYSQGTKSGIGKNFSEELYVETDRSLYIAGEQVYFKVFLMSRLSHTFSNVSKVAYITLLDNYSNPVVQLKVFVDGYSGEGAFFLPDTLATGNYLIRSCTIWMQNASEDLFSYKKISVINPFNKISRIRLPLHNPIPDSVVFYPESGYLVTGIESRVGFKCFDKNGNTTKTEGFIIDNTDTISKIDSQAGIGIVSLKPSGTGALYLVVTGKNTTIRKFPLPQALPAGITLSGSIDSKLKMVKIKVYKKNNLPDNNRYFLTCYPESFTPLKKEVIIYDKTEINIPQNSLPYGLINIYLSNEKGDVVGKRWFYNDNQPSTHFKVNVEKATYNNRERVNVDITATDDEGNPVKSDLILSVAKSFASLNNVNDNFVQSPYIAIFPDNSGIYDINDQLIFAYNDILLTGNDNDPSPTFIPETEGLLLRGIMFSSSSGEPLKNTDVVLSFVGKKAVCSFSKTDENGNFIFQVREKGKHEIVIQPLFSDLKNYYVEIKNPFPATFKNYNTGFYYIDSTRLGEINDAIISMQVNSLYEPFRQAKKANTKIAAENNFYGTPDISVNATEYIELSSVKEIVKEIVPNVFMYKKDGKSNFKLVSQYQGQTYESSPLVIMDGSPVNDIDKLLNISAKEIEKVEVLKTRYFISDMVFEGIINFTTKQGKLSSMDFDPSTFRQEYEALHEPSEFFNPDYSIDSLKKSRIPDFRNTLCWNPDLSTDNNGKTTFSFYTSDEPGQYTISIKGLSQDGQFGKANVSFNVISKAD